MAGGFIRTVRSLRPTGDLIITGRVMEYLLYTGHMNLEQEDAELIHDLLMDKSNDIRHSRFGASTRGDCQRKQVFAYLGMPGKGRVDPILNNLFLDGQWRHLRWQIMGIKAGVFTHVEVPVKKKSLRLGLSVDAVNVDEKFIFELKGTRFMFDAPPYKHMLQMHTYMLATGYDTAVYVAEDKSSQDWKEWVIRRDPKIMKEVEDELNDLNEAIEHRKLPPPLPQATSKAGECSSCPYNKDCVKQGRIWPQGGKWDETRQSSA